MPASGQLPYKLGRVENLLCALKNILSPVLDLQKQKWLEILIMLSKNVVIMGEKHFYILF